MAPGDKKFWPIKILLGNTRDMEYTEYRHLRGLYHDTCCRSLKDVFKLTSKPTHIRRRTFPHTRHTGNNYLPVELQAVSINTVKCNAHLVINVKMHAAVISVIFLCIPGKTQYYCLY